MPFLLRVELPDVPGSLGRLATAIGEAGGDIEAIEIVEKRHDGTAVDDVLLEMPAARCRTRWSRRSTCSTGVEVVWISRYAAGGNLFLDLEVVEELTEDPAKALDRVVDLLPDAFRADWAVRGAPIPRHRHAAPPEHRSTCRSWSSSAPPGSRSRATRRTSTPAPASTATRSSSSVAAAAQSSSTSELARLGHLVSLAASLARP